MIRMREKRERGQRRKRRLSSRSAFTLSLPRSLPLRSAPQTIHLTVHAPPVGRAIRVQIVKQDRVPWLCGGNFQTRTRSVVLHPLGKLLSLCFRQRETRLASLTRRRRLQVNQKRGNSLARLRAILFVVEIIVVRLVPPSREVSQNVEGLPVGPWNSRQSFEFSFDGVQEARGVFGGRNKVPVAGPDAFFVFGLLPRAQSKSRGSKLWFDCVCERGG